MASEALPNQLPSSLLYVISYHCLCQPHWNSCCPFNTSSTYLRAFVFAVPISPPEVHIAGALISFRPLSNVTLPEIFSNPFSKTRTPYSPYSSSLCFCFPFSFGEGGCVFFSYKFYYTDFGQFLPFLFCMLHFSVFIS